MLNDIVEARKKKEDYYEVILQIPEKEFFNSYDDISDTAAKEILTNYLRHHQDDGKPHDIEIKHSKPNHIVSIETKLYYEDNDHTRQLYI